MATRDVKVGSLAPGVNNRLPPTELDTALPDRTKATFLYGADNVDINKRGYLKRRRGQTQALAGDAHSIWGDDLGAFAVLDGNLVALAESGPGIAASVVRAGMPHMPLSYSRGADGAVYWSNSQYIRRVVNGVDRPIVTEPLAAVPDVTVGAGGLRGGLYLVAMTVSGPDGESPATPAVQVEVPENGSLQVDAPTLIGLTVNLYASAPSGDILTLQATAATGLFNIVTQTDTGRLCRTLNRAIMPAGSIVRHYKGSLLVANGPNLFISDPYYFGVYNPSKGYIPFDAPIAVVEPTPGGIYVATERAAWWLAGNLGDTVALQVQPFGAAPGSSGQSPSTEEVYWMSDHGIVIGDQSGSVRIPQDGPLEFSDAVAGASIWRERDGMHHLVSSRFLAPPSLAAASSFMEAEIVRKGTIL